MPKTSMYENDFTSTREYQVGITRQAPVMEPIAIAHSVHKAPDYHLGLRILRPNPAHPLASPGGGQGVHLALS